MEGIIEWICQYYYRRYREKCLKINPVLSQIRESLINFGGFVENFDWLGRTKPNQEVGWVDGIKIYQHTIHLNKIFSYSCLGLLEIISPKNKIFVSLFTYQQFLDTLAHEITHCVMADFFPDEEEHGDLHKFITEEIREDYLKKDSLLIKWSQIWQ